MGLYFSRLCIPVTLWHIYVAVVASVTSPSTGTRTTGF